MLGNLRVEKYHYSLKITLIFWGLLFSFDSFSACGVTNLTWDAGGGNTQFGKATNWNPDNVPDTSTENAIIVSAARATQIQVSNTVGCVDVQSGQVLSKNGNTLTVVGDYFQALTSNSIAFTAGDVLTIDMAGATAQRFDVVDPINYLTISNNSSVDFNYPFEIRNSLTLSGTGTTLNIYDNLNLSDSAGTFTIPSSNTVIVHSGVNLTIAGSLTINGTLRILPGGTVSVGNTQTITVASGAELRLEGASGNPAIVKATSGSISANIAGALWAQYFRFDGIDTAGAGLNVTGTISKLEYGEFHFIPSAGYALTLGSGVSAPATMAQIGFYDDNAYANNFNINASSFNSSNIQLDNWAGIGGATYENDPNNRIDWGAAAGTKLTISNNSNVGFPSDPVVAGSALQEFAIFQFNLSNVSTATDITSVTFSLTGTSQSSDVDFIRVYNQGATCQTVGTQIGTDLTMSGSPAQATITIPPGTVTTDGSTSACIHVYLQTTASAENSATIGIEVSGTADVTNSFGYSFSDTSGPPVGGSIVTISGDATRLWTGTNSSNWRTNNNWQNGSYPDAAANCKISTGSNDLILTESNACQNMTFPTGGVTNFNNGAFNLDIFGSLTTEASYTFSNAASGSLSMVGASNQAISMATTFPGSLIINNTGGASSIISVDSNATFNGSLTVTSGTLRVSTGSTLTILGNVVVQSGAVLDIESGGILALGNGSSLTVDAGGTLELIGGATPSTVTSTGGTDAITVVVNGTIKANNYIFDHLGLSGVTINSGATIDATNYLLNGTFKHPVNDNSTLLNLFKAIPGNTLSGMTFDLNGSAANSATITNIYTDASIGAGTLNITSFSGNLGGSIFDNDNSYLISWSGETTTIDVTQEATGPVQVYQGQTYNMGRFGFQQTQAGAGYMDTNITSFTLTLMGTGSSNDVTAARLYYDSDCNSTGGTLLGTAQTFSGNPATATFSGISALVEASATAPPLRCIYVEFDIASDAVNSQTLGVEFSQASHLVDDQGYGVAGGTPPPIDLGTYSTIIGSSTTWTGAIDTDWFNAGNWNGGLPTSSLNCNIGMATNNPVIASGTGTCNSISIGSLGILTVNTGATLETYGSLDNSGTFTMNGTLSVVDGGLSTTNQTLTGVTTLNSLSINKSLGGTFQFVGTSLTANSFTMAGSTSFIAYVNTNQTLIVPTGMTISGGIFRMNSSSTLEVGNGQTVSMTGGGFYLVGTPSTAPGSTLNKAWIKPQGGTGSWNFNSTGGIVLIRGFVLDQISTNGFVVGGNTTISEISGGQFINLSTSYASVKVMQINTTGSIVSTATDVGWNWSPNGTFPQPTDGYLIASSTGCGGQTIEFTGWYGDWYENPDTFDTSTLVSNTNCNIILGGSSSAVDLLSFSANPYNSSVDLKWETALETNHLGFNVYRADETGENIIQINDDIVRNVNNFGSKRGTYRFVDFTALNDKLYRYYIEDVEINGVTTLHGPVWARPLDGLGSAPADDPADNNGDRPGTDPANPSESVITNPGYKDLGDGIVILGQTQNSLRLKIVPANITFSPSTWDGSYETALINGFQKSTIASNPENLEKVLLLEVGDASTGVTGSEVSLLTSNLTAHNLAPAPNYVDDGNGNLIPEYSLNDNIYSLDALYPQIYYQVEPNTIKIGQKYFVKVKIYPFKINPVQQIVTRIDELVLDVHLGSTPWDMTPKEVGMTPYMVPNTLAIHYNKTGLYEITYDDLVNSEVEGPLSDSNVNDLRLYYWGSEIPISIESSDAYFNSGDKILAYLPFSSSAEDIKNVAILSHNDIFDSGNSPLRIQTVDGTPIAGADSRFEDHLSFVTSEQNNLFIDGESVGYGLDHFYWGRVMSDLAHTYPSLETYDIPLILNGHNANSSRNVDLKIYVKGTFGGNPYTIHHLGVYINNYAPMYKDFVFDSNEPGVLSLSVPAQFFFDGTNNIRIQSLGSYLEGSVYDVVYFDKVVARYPSLKQANNNVANIDMEDINKNQIVTGFSGPSLHILDVSNVENIKNISNAAITTADGGVSYDARFFAAQSFGGKRLFVTTLGNYLKPIGLTINHGVETKLQSISNRADLLIVGPRQLIDASWKLIEHRQQEGLEVKAVDMNDIYAEFSFGQQSSEALRSLVHYANQYWEKKPQYLLILGDGTYDPKDLFEFGARKNTLPMPIVKGDATDFGADNWFASTDENRVPVLAVGRIPTDDPQKLEKYIDKVIDYENGVTSPDLSIAKNLSFIADSSDISVHEKFEQKVDSLSSMEGLKEAKFSSTVYKRALMTDADLHTEIINQFDNEQFVITYYGHGADDRWAGSLVFKNSDVDNLTNSKLPIVVTLDCENASFYDADETTLGLGEKLILKENGGAIAFFGSTALTMPNAQKKMADAFFEKLSTISKNGDSNVRLGEVFFQTKVVVGNEGYSKDVVQSFSLLGDPSMKMPADMFMPAPVTSGETQVAPGASSGGGGCSAGAADGSKIPWTHGLMEWLFFVGLIFGIRRIARISGIG